MSAVLTVMTVVATALGGCASTQSSVTGAFAPPPKASASRTASSRAPMFPESKWGVSASRRVAAGERIPKGGGHYKVGAPYQVGGRWYQPREQPDYDRIGVASWYGSDFHGRKTANGEIFDMRALTAAHPTLPMPSYAYVTNVGNNRTILVRINDRGPYVGDRMIDLSKRSAEVLGLRSGGTGKVRVRYAGPAPLDGNDARERQFLASRPWTGGAEIAALESEQSAREWAAHRSAAEAPPAWRREEPQLRSAYAEAPMANDGRRHARAYAQSYAEASPGAVPAAWSPSSYRASLLAR